MKPKFRLKKKIHSMFDSIPKEENKNITSPLFRKTSFGPKKKDIPKILKEEEPAKPPSRALKKSAQEILKDIPRSITQEMKKVPFFTKKKLESKGTIGLDIGTGAIKFAHITGVGGKPVLIDTGIKAIPDDIKEDSSKKDNFVIQYIQSAFKGDLRKVPVYLGFNHPELAIELVKIPKVEEKDIQKAILWKAQEQLSIQDVNTVSLDYLVLGEKEESGEHLIYVLVIVTPKRIISHFVEELFKIGLDIRAVEPNPLALYALLDKAGELKAGELALVLDLGASGAALSIVTNKELQFSRELPFSGDSITRSIAEYCRVDFDKAKVLKEKWGSNEGSIDTQIANAIHMHLESLSSEIVRSFQYFSFTITKSTIKEMNKIVLTGGMSRLRDLDKFLNERLKIPATVFNPLETVQIDEDRLDVKRLEADAHKLSIAISLALRD